MRFVRLSKFLKKEAVEKELLKELERAVREIEACGELVECVVRVRKAVELAKELQRRIDCSNVECLEAKAALDEFVQYLEWYLQYVRSFMRSLIILDAMLQGDNSQKDPRRRGL
jgi:hypothetical protein